MTQQADNLLASWVSGAPISGSDAAALSATWERLKASEGFALDAAGAFGCGAQAKQPIGLLGVAAGMLEVSTAATQPVTLADSLGFIVPLFGTEPLTLTGTPTAALERTLRAAELLRQLDTLRSQSELPVKLAASLAVGSMSAPLSGLLLSETLTLVEGAGFRIGLALLAGLAQQDVAAGGLELGQVLGAQFNLQDVPAPLLGLPLVETLSLTPSLEEIVGNFLKAMDGLGLQSQALPVLETMPQLREAMLLHDQLAVLRVLGLTEAMVVSDALASLQASKASESLGLAERAAIACELVGRLLETFSAAELAAVLVRLGAAESLTLSTVLLEEVVMVLVAQDPMGFLDRLLAVRELGLELDEGLELSPVAALRSLFSLGETVTLGSEAVMDLLQWLLAAEGLQLSPVVGLLQEAARRAAERITVAERVLPAVGPTVSESLALASGLAMLHGLELQQQLQLTEQAVPVAELLVMFQELVSFVDFSGKVFALGAAEQLQLTEQLLQSLATPLVEQLGLAEAAGGVLFVGLGLAEQLQATDAATSVAELLFQAQASLLFIERLPLGDDVYSAWAFNSDTLTMTQYSNFPMNSFMESSGRLYGVAADGLYLLEGDDDAGAAIETLVCTGDLNFGHLGQKYVPRAYLLITKPGNVLLKTHSYNHGQQREHFYEVVLRASDDVGLVRVPLRRELRSEFWAFELQNVDGGDFELQGAEVLPVLLSRRV